MFRLCFADITYLIPVFPNFFGSNDLVRSTVEMNHILFVRFVSFLPDIFFFRISFSLKMMCTVYYFFMVFLQQNKTNLFTYQFLLSNVLLIAVIPIIFHQN